MREKGFLRTGSLAPGVSKPSGRWYIDPNGTLLYGGDHSLTIRRAKEGLQIARSVLEEMGASEITPTDIPVNLTPQSGGAHKVGSCRAGVDPKTSVVNPSFESHDVDNLFVCDGSVIPRAPTGASGAPQACVSVLGETSSSMKSPRGWGMNQAGNRGLVATAFTVGSAIVP